MEKNYNYLKTLYSNFRDFQLHEGLYVEDYAPPGNSIFLYPAETEYNPYDFQEIQTFEIDFFIYEQNFTIGIVDEIINIYKRELIGKKRFNPELVIAEDYDFNQKVRKGKKANIKEVLYYYEQFSPDSLIKSGRKINDKYKKGK